MPHSTSPSIQTASSALEAMDNALLARRVEWNILRNNLLELLFQLPYTMLLELTAIHRLQGLLSPPAESIAKHNLFARRAAIARRDAVAGEFTMAFDTPSWDCWVDIGALEVCDMETSLIPGQHIDVSFLAYSKKRELIFRILLRMERMRDNALCYNGGGGEEDRLWMLGKYLIEVMRVKFEEGGSMGMGGRTGPLPAEKAVPKIVLSNFTGYEERKGLNKVTGVKELRMRENEVL